MHVQLGQIMDKKMQKDQGKKKRKAQLALLNGWEKKQGVRSRSKSKVLCMPPELNTTKGMGKSP